MSRRKKIIVIAIIIAIIAVLLCGLILKYFDSKNNKSYIVLSTAAGTPYEWNCKVEDKSIATIEHVYKKNLDPKVDGGEIQIKYLIKGLKKGHTIVNCIYSRDDEKIIVENNIYDVTVDEKLNVEILND